MLQLDKYPFLLILISVILGIALYAYHDKLLIPTAIVSFAIIVFILSCRNKKIHNHLIYISYLPFIGIAYTISYYKDIKTADNWYNKHSFDYFESTIIDAPAITPKTIRYKISINAGFKAATKTKCKGIVLLYVYKSDSAATLNISDVILIPNKIKPIQHINNPNAFNYASYLAKQQIYHQAFLAHNEIYKTNISSTNILQQLKQQLGSSIDKNVKDEDTKQLIKASLLNERAMLSESIWESYSKTGIVHIIAISGMHITLLFGIIVFLLSFIKHKKYIWIAYLIALPLLWLYIIITDMPASAVRAGLMFSITALSIFIQKPQQSLNTLFVAAAIMLLIQPNWLYDIGMQLSFICMLSIILFFQPLQSQIKSKNKFIQFLWMSISMSIAVQILTAPVALYYFNQFPIFTFIANIPAALYSTFLLASAILIFILDMLSIPATLIGNLTFFVTKCFNYLINLLAEATPASLQSIYIDIPDAILLLITSITLYFTLLYRQSKDVQLLLTCTAIYIFNKLIQLSLLVNHDNVIVYNINNRSYAVWIQNLSHIKLNIDTISPMQFKRNIQPSLIRVNAMKENASLTGTQLINSNQKTILLLNDKIKEKSPPYLAPLDIAIINQHNYNHFPTLLKKIPAKLFVLDSSFKRWQYLKIESFLKSQKKQFHNVQTMGAWQANN